MFLLFFNIQIIIMNQILLYKVNVCLKRYYKCTLFGLIFLMVIILGIVYKNSKVKLDMLRKYSSLTYLLHKDNHLNYNIL